MSDPASFSTPNILRALQRIHEEGLTGELSLPYESAILSIGFVAGGLATVDSSFAACHFLPKMAEKGVSTGDVFLQAAGAVPLVPDKSVLGHALDFFCATLCNLFQPGSGVLIQFEPKPVHIPPGAATIAVPLWVCRFISSHLSERSLREMAWDMSAKVMVAPDYMARASRSPLETRQAYVLTRLHDGVTLKELIQSCSVPEDQVLRAMLIFSFLHITDKVRPQPRDRGGSPAQPPPPPDVAAPRRAGPAAGPPPGEKSAPAQAQPSRSANRQPKAAESSGEFATVELLSEVDDMAILAEKGDFFALFELPVHAEAEEVKKRFFELTKKYHPDKFQRYSNPGLLAKVDTIFSKITEGYETLKDPVLRSAYADRTRPKHAGFPAGKEAGAAPPTQQQPDPKRQPDAAPGKTPVYENVGHKAQQHFIHGKEAFKNKKFHDAVEHFREAVRISPERPDFQYMLGKTLSLNPQKKKEAEDRLLQALDMRPEQPEFLMEVARFYESVNLKLRARKYWEKIHELNPKQPEAMLALGLKPQKQPFSFKNLLKLDLKDIFKSGKNK